ncbi:uncharacterized protein [Lepeophtheirus salmonis]|uniref:uncharacterized protein n=1 Tax=Lepeophtheirus salmonis TaxID=72036 RepID=UPI001AEA2822|nr:clumping factor A-like [Lepeophtheirus salmonis]
MYIICFNFYLLIIISILHNGKAINTTTVASPTFEQDTYDKKWPEEITQLRPEQFYDCLYNYYFCTDHYGSWPDNKDACFKEYIACESAVSNTHVIQGTIKDLPHGNYIEQESEYVVTHLEQNSGNKEDENKDDKQDNDSKENESKETNNGNSQDSNVEESGNTIKEDIDIGNGSTTDDNSGISNNPNFESNKDSEKNSGSNLNEESINTTLAEDVFITDPSNGNDNLDEEHQLDSSKDESSSDSNKADIEIGSNSSSLSPEQENEVVTNTDTDLGDKVNSTDLESNQVDSDGEENDLDPNKSESDGEKETDSDSYKIDSDREKEIDSDPDKIDSDGDKDTDVYPDKIDSDDEKETDLGPDKIESDGDKENDSDPNKSDFDKEKETDLGPDKIKSDGDKENDSDPIKSDFDKEKETDLDPNKIGSDEEKETDLDPNKIDSDGEKEPDFESNKEKSDEKESSSTENNYQPDMSKNDSKTDEKEINNEDTNVSNEGEINIPVNGGEILTDKNEKPPKKNNKDENSNANENELPSSTTELYQTQAPYLTPTSTEKNSNTDKEELFTLSTQSSPLTGPKSCSAIIKMNDTSPSGIYTLLLDGKGKQVYCEMKNGDGWTLLQRRGEFENEENYFYRNWEEYKDGFGDLNDEHWVGLESMFELTNEEKKVDLRFILEDYEGNRTAVTLVEFRVANEESGYRLFYKGIINHSRSKYPLLGRSVPAKGTKFSTFDKDNDEWKGNCAVRFSGGWWYSACHNSNINGLNLRGPHKSFGNGVNWYHFRGYHYSLKATEMKIKPSSPRGQKKKNKS